MSAIAFDPWAALQAHQETVAAAKVAKPANLPPGRLAQLAALAGLAGTSPPTSAPVAVSLVTACGTTAVLYPWTPRSHSAERDLSLLSHWRAGVERLVALPCPSPIEAGRWSALGTTALRLLSQHGQTLHGAGWGTLDLYGLHQHAPATFPPGWGLAWLLEAAGDVLDVQPNEIAFRRTPGGARLVFLRRRSIPGVIPAWCLGSAC